MKNPKSKSSGSRSSARKTAANQQNAKKSTGPRTVAGKARSGQNALKHGFCAATVVLPGEDLLAFQVLRENLWAGVCPQNVLEALYVKEIVDTTWRLQRLGSVEGGIFVRQSLSAAGKQCGMGFAFVNDAGDADAFSKLGVYEAALTRRLHKAMQQLRLLREKGWQELPACDAPESEGDASSQPADSSPPASAMVKQNTANSPSPSPGTSPPDPLVHSPADGAVQGKATGSFDPDTSASLGES